MWCLNLHSHFLRFKIFKGFHPHLEDGTPWMYIGFGFFFLVVICVKLPYDIWGAIRGAKGMMVFSVAK